ncbi:hypothetical protein [Streptomyces sp. NPDC096030]|uniref:hypothetical protein n=1 Tax=Streptomyces sp. NPDC096030 TaxID=3155423 RepID=UPI0033254FD6
MNRTASRLSKTAGTGLIIAAYLTVFGSQVFAQTPAASQPPSQGLLQAGVQDSTAAATAGVPAGAG